LISLARVTVFVYRAQLQKKSTRKNLPLPIDLAVAMHGVWKKDQNIPQCLYLDGFVI